MVEEPTDESGMFYRDTLAQLCTFFTILFVLFILPVLVIVNVRDILNGLMEEKEREMWWWWWKSGDESECLIMGSSRGFYRGFYVFPVILVKASLLSIAQDIENEDVRKHSDESAGLWIFFAKKFVKPGT